MTDHVEIPMEPVGAPQRTNEARDIPQQCNPNGSLLGKTPTPIYRHAAPSGPWPWMDFDEDMPTVPPPPPRTGESDEAEWSEYPQNLFPNWTKCQVDRCEMLSACPVGESTVFKVDVEYSGEFGHSGTLMEVVDDETSRDEFWELIHRERPEGIRVRALFVKNMTKDILQMMGTRYNIEPFFFSSSTKWIPSRYRENLKQTEVEKSDHITTVLPFIRVIDRVSADLPLPGPPQSELGPLLPGQEDDQEQIIDTQSPLYLDSCDKYILQDLLSIHMIRNSKSSTIISYHPKQRPKTAVELHSLINRTGRSVYWQNIFKNSKDPTCLFLCYLWYAMYAWDEVFEVLYTHINHLEQKVLGSEDIRGTRELHILQAHLLYYRTLLEDFKKSVKFVQTNENPAMQDFSLEERQAAEKIMKRETDYLVSEVERLESQRSMQVMRLKNVIDLAFSTVNIEDSRYMKELTVATVRDSAAMKQISYLTMVFLPANFLSNLFSMNVVEINPQGGETMVHYVVSAVGLTVFAMWLAIALQAESIFFKPGSPMWRRVGWPVLFVYDKSTEYYQKYWEKTKKA